MSEYVDYIRLYLSEMTDPASAKEKLSFAGINMWPTKPGGTRGYRKSVANKQWLNQTLALTGYSLPALATNPPPGADDVRDDGCEKRIGQAIWNQKAKPDVDLISDFIDLFGCTRPDARAIIESRLSLLQSSAGPNRPEAIDIVDDVLS